MISEKGIRFRHPDYDPDRAQKYHFVHVPTSVHMQNFIQMHTFLSNLANRKTDKGGGKCDRWCLPAITFASSFVGGNKGKKTKLGISVCSMSSNSHFSTVSYNFSCMLKSRRFWRATHDCVAPYVDIILHRERF